MLRRPSRTSALKVRTHPPTLTSSTARNLYGLDDLFLEVGSRFLPTESDWLVPSILGEVIGSTYLVMMYFAQFEEKHSFDKKDPLMWSFILAGGYAGAGLIGKANSGGVINPAMGVMINLVSLFDGNSKIKYIWLHGAVPFAGTFLGILLYKIYF